nr:GGDEF domain-containing protein [Bradyrhizobium sp. 186]
MGGASLGLILLDLDQFKSVNDTCGHLAGDRLLCQIARLLQQNRRPQDLVARLGGDEFGLILPQCSPYDAVNIAERLRTSLELFSFAWDGRCFAVTASIGVACIADGNYHARGRVAARRRRLLSRQGEGPQPGSGRHCATGRRAGRVAAARNCRSARLMAVSAGAPSSDQEASARRSCA